MKTSPRKAFSLAMRGGLKDVCAAWEYSKETGAMVGIEFDLNSDGVVMRRQYCFGRVGKLAVALE